MTPITQVCDPQIIQHQFTFVVSDSVNHLCVYDNIIKAIRSGTNSPILWPLQRTSNEGCWRNGILRKPNSTTNAFSYGFSISPLPRVLRTSIAEPTIGNTSCLSSSLSSLVSISVH